MDNKKTTNTLIAFKELMRTRQGGALSFSSVGYYPISSPLYSWASKRPANYKPFVISIISTEYGGYYDTEDLITLGLFINPSDMQIGNVNISSNQFTRKGWVSTLWGSQQSTVSANGSSAGFYYKANESAGITNFSRKDAISFVNLLSLISMFKNNGANHSKSPYSADMYKTGTSRIIDVMDSIKISYDGSEYLGDFISFTIEEDATQPFKMSYSFEFVINGISSDAYYFEGHLGNSLYEPYAPLVIGIQGSGSEVVEKIKVSGDAIRSNADVNLNETAYKEDEDFRDKVSKSTGKGNDTKHVLTAAEKKDSASLLQAQIDTGGTVVRGAQSAAEQINNIREYNKNIALHKNANLSATEALKRVNEKIGITGKSAEVTLATMNSMLFMENNVGLAVSGKFLPNAETSSAKGLTQIVRGTYDEIVNKTDFVEFMLDNFKSGGYTEESIKNAHRSGDLSTDPLLGYIAGAFYFGAIINPTIVKDGLQPTPQISGLAYHNGPGSYNELVTQNGSDYAVTINKYISYLSNLKKIP
jgi:hypothetical protein